MKISAQAVSGWPRGSCVLSLKARWPVTCRDQSFSECPGNGLTSLKEYIMTVQFQNAAPFGGDEAHDHALVASPDEIGGIVLPGRSKAERSVPAASSAHCTGFGVLGDGPGVRMQGESLLECNHFYVLNTLQNVAEMREQARFYFGWDQEKQKQHIFDVLVTLTCGKRIAFTIKPEVRLVSGRFEAQMQEISWWVHELCFADDVRILTEADLDPVELYNAKVLAGVRERDSEAESAARAALQDLPAGGGQSLRDLTLATGMAARGYRALIRLLRTGEARLQTRERIRPGAVIVNAGLSRSIRHLSDHHGLIVSGQPGAVAA